MRGCGDAGMLPHPACGNHFSSADRRRKSDLGLDRSSFDGRKSDAESTMPLPNESHPLYAMHRAAAVIQRAYRMHRARHQAQHYADKALRTVKAEWQVRQALAQLDAKLERKLNRLDALARDRDASRKEWRVGYEVACAERIQRWWRRVKREQEVTTRPRRATRAEPEVIDLTRFPVPKAIAHHLAAVPQAPPSPWRDEPLSADIPQAHFSAVRDLRRMHAAQRAIDARLGSRVFVRDWAKWQAHVVDELAPKWEQCIAGQQEAVVELKSVVEGLGKMLAAVAAGVSEVQGAPFPCL